MNAGSLCGPLQRLLFCKKLIYVSILPSLILVANLIEIPILANVPEITSCIFQRLFFSVISSSSTPNTNFIMYVIHASLTLIRYLPTKMKLHVKITSFLRDSSIYPLISLAVPYESLNADDRIDIKKYLFENCSFRIFHLSENSDTQKNQTTNHSINGVVIIINGALPIVVCQCVHILK
ncbi:unnamed protein product [Onchocerca flexuosa]|uniref:Uncharacterized protein n=1 Tax=Onchocerca flexuosa TaxID=387005 RepID=A0A183I2H0_9BILA|nr:unnamed protein product [Onchocerca flexuosa]